MRHYLPKPTIVSQPFWDSCREGVLRLQQCQACRRYIFYPGYICFHCGASDLVWKETSGRGQVYSCTVVERQAGTDDDPMAVALVHLDEGPIMMSNVVETDPYTVGIGDRVRVTFQVASEEISLPVFRPDNDAQ